MCTYTFTKTVLAVVYQRTLRDTTTAEQYQRIVAETRGRGLSADLFPQPADTLQLKKYQ
jgi:hypothetical protein